MDFAVLRENMVESQVRPNGVTDKRISDRMRALPRELFVPKARRPIAYMDEAVAISETRVLMPPMVFAKLLQEAEIEATDSVLVIGAGYGYAAAVVAALADSVIALEEDEALAEHANEALAEAGIDTVAVVTGNLRDGSPDQSPYDVILIDGAVEEVPQGLLDQLAEGGRLVTVRLNGLAGYAEVYLNRNGSIGHRVAFDARIPLLPGFEKARQFTF